MTVLSKSADSFAAICLALFATLLLIATFVSACGFDDTIQHQAEEDGAKNTNVKNLPDENARRSSTYDNIRIKFSTDDLFDTSKYCTAAGETKPDFKGSTRTCSAEDVFTAEKRSEFINVIIPDAINKLQRALRVVRLTSNLVVGSTSQCTGGFTIPASHTSTGIADADYMIYVAAGPTAVGNVAFAGSCQYDGNTPRRSVVGRANFGPYYLSRTRMPIRDAVNTMVHEILHALGFSSTEFNHFSLTSSVTVRGISKTLITAAKPKSEASKWMGCGSLPGVELENQGGSGTELSHVDRRVYPDDLMAGAGGEALSVVTLSIMESLGVYLPYYNESENSVTGKGLGCIWHTGSCTDNSAAWCTGTGSDCTSNLRAYGTCSDPFLTDDCRYVNAFSNKKCYDLSQSDSDDTGDTFDNNSRCFKTSGTFKKSGSNVIPSNDLRCLKAQCFSDILSFTVGRSSVNYVTCLKDGTRSYSGYQGSVVCPNITLMCSSLQRYHNASDTDDDLLPITPISFGKTYRASDFLYTTKLTLTLSGSGWPNIIKDHYSDLFIAMQKDVAQILSIEAQQVWVMSVTAGSSNTVQFVININDPQQSTTAIQGEFSAYLGRRAWMPRTANLYSSKSGASDKASLGAAGASDKPENACTKYIPSFEDTDQCNGFIAGLVIAAVAFLAIIFFSIYCCCCKYQDPPEKVDRSVKYEVQLPRKG